jgi:hypothetical protein
VPISHCVVATRQDSFVSNDAGCEGQSKEFALGYALRRSDALLRFWLPSTSTHFVGYVLGTSKTTKVRIRTAR